MANKRNRNFNNNKRGNKTIKSKTFRRNNQRNNFQDAAEDREYNKGFNAGRRNMITPVSGLQSTDNDASWYIPNGQMARDVLSIPESIGAGKPIKQTLSNGTGAASQYQVVPGICAFNVMSLIPSDNRGINSPINRAGLSMYQAIQAANSRSPQYGMPLIMMYLIAHTDLLSLYQYLTRAYGVLRNYSYYDLYTPDALLKAMHIEPVSLKNNLAEFRTQLNQLADAMAALVIPSAFTYADKKIFLYSNIYKDADTAKAQYYMYTPVGFYTWEEGKPKDPAGNSGLTYLQFMDLKTFQIIEGDTNTQWMISAFDLIDLAWEMVTSLRNSEDIRNIGADLIKAFGINKMYKVNPIAETFTVTPVHNKEVLSQMENAFVYPGRTYQYSSTASSTTNYTVTASICQNPGIQDNSISAEYIYQQQFYWKNSELDVFNSLVEPGTGGSPDISFLTLTEPDVYLLNFHEQSVTPELLLTSSRFTTAKQLQTITIKSESNSSTTDSYFTVDPETTEIILGMDWYYWSYDSFTINTTTPKLTHRLTQTYELYNDDGDSSPINRMSWFENFVRTSLWSEFDWAPRVVNIAYNLNGNKPKIDFTSAPLWDIDNYFELPKTLLTNVNYMATVALFQPRGLPNVNE